MKKLISKVFNTFKNYYAKKDIIHFPHGKYYKHRGIILSVDGQIGYDLEKNLITEYKSIFIVEETKKRKDGSRVMRMVCDEGGTKSSTLFEVLIYGGCTVESAESHYEISKEEFQKLFRNSICNCRVGQGYSAVIHSNSVVFINKYIKSKYGADTRYRMTDRGLYFLNDDGTEECISRVPAYNYRIVFCANCETLMSKSTIEKVDKEIKGHVRRSSFDKFIEEKCIA